MEPKSKFRNTSGGVAGAIQLDHQNQAKGIPVYPNEEVWLTEQEQVLTANAPRNPEDNPFENGTFTLEVKAQDVAHSRPIGDLQEVPAEYAGPEPPEETEIVEEQPAAEAGLEVGAAEPPEGDAPEGQAAEHEEVADAPEEHDEHAEEVVEELSRPVPPPPPKPLPRPSD